MDTLNQVLVSVIAGLSLSKMKEQFPSVKNHVRIMTNTAVTIGEGVMAITPDESCPEPVVDNIKQILSKCGCLEVKGSHKVIETENLVLEKAILVLKAVFYSYGPMIVHKSMTRLAKFQTIFAH